MEETTSEDRRYRVLDAARAVGVDPEALTRWLALQGADVTPGAGGLVARADLEASLARRGLALPSDLRSFPRILIVDDHPDAVRLARWTLEDAFPYAVVRGVDSGAAALDQLADFRPDLVVTDLRMPDGIDGFALCERVAADRSLRATKIVVLSGDASPSSTVRAFERGAAAFLPKPARDGSLADAARRLLGLSAPVSDS
ncbi:MAG TPA: response regulator [Elusimicrobiota bacterium]|nr:response regulator [Elusimicrobiota bacterium]